MFRETLTGMMNILSRFHQPLSMLPCHRLQPLEIPRARGIAYKWIAALNACRSAALSLRDASTIGLSPSSHVFVHKCES